MSSRGGRTIPWRRPSASNVLLFEATCPIEPAAPRPSPSWLRSETGPALAKYRTGNGFTGTYAIAGDEVARALAADFGDQVLNPPSTPMILIGADGRVTLTDFGHKPAAAVVRLARDHGA
ncbi:MAG: hypothetical protein ACT452_00010 [Microthrixaceae bacterium]